MSVIVDPSLMMPAAPRVATAGQRYFNADDSGVDYWIVARDLAHAQKILGDAGVVFVDEDGDEHSDPTAAHVDWTEIPADRAAQIMCWSENGSGEHKPLAEYAIGDWFCSEY